MDEHKNIPAGKYVIKFYDEEGYADLRKVSALLKFAPRSLWISNKFWVSLLFPFENFLLVQLVGSEKR